jgi:hypothetical protein
LKEKNATLKEKDLHAKKKPNYISAFLLLNFHTKNILIKCDYLKKRINLFKNDFFLESYFVVDKEKRLLEKLVELLQFYVEIVILSSFSSTENAHCCYLDLARNTSETYSFECVKFYTSCFFYVKLQLDILLTLLLQVAKNKQTISKLEKQQTKERKQNTKIYQT